MLIGATAIEDKLQDDVPDTIATLAEVTYCVCLKKETEIVGRANIQAIMYGAML